METKSGIQILSVSATYVPSLEQQTTEKAMVRFINFSIRLNSIACKLELSFFLAIKLTPVWRLRGVFGNTLRNSAERELKVTVFVRKGLFIAI